MIRPKPDVPERTPVLSFPTPEGQADLLFYESRDGDLPKNKSWTYGDPHPDRAKFPHHELVYVDESESGWQRWYYAADRENQHLYNWQLTNTTDWPQLTQTFLVRRSEYTLLATTPTTDLPPTFRGQYVWTFMGEEVRDASEIERGLFVVLMRTWQDTREARQTHTLDNDTGEIVTSERRIVPESAQATKIDRDGRFTEITPLSTLVSVATTRQAAGLAGQAVFGKSARTIPLTDNYPWPPMLQTIDITPVLSNPGDAYSTVTGYNWRPVWYSEGYNGPCRGELRETWYQKKPIVTGDANWKMGPDWAANTVYTAEVTGPPLVLASYVSYNGESYKCTEPHTSGLTFDSTKWTLVSPLIPTETPMLTRSIEFYGRDLTISGMPRCLHPQMTIQDSQFRGTYPATTPLFWPRSVLARVRVSPDQGGWLLQEWWYYSPDLSGLTPSLLLDVVAVGSSSFTLQWTPQAENSPILPMELDVCLRADFKSGFLPGYKGKVITPAGNTPPLQTVVTDAPRGVNIYCRVRRIGSTTSNPVLVSCEPMAELYVTVDGVSVERPTTLNLSNVLQGTGKVLTVALKNTGVLSLDNLVATKSGDNPGDITVGTLPGNIAPEGTGTFTITVNPAAAGSRLATVSLASSAIEDTPWVFDLIYTGVTPEINVKMNGDSYTNGSTITILPSVDTGSFSTVPLIIENTGTGILNVAATLVPVLAEAGEFTLTNVPDTVPPGGSATLNVIFSPKAGGTRTATLSLANNDISDGENPYVLTLSGTGNAVGEIEIHDPDGYVLGGATGVYDFGTVGTSAGDPKTKVFTIFNRGAGSLTGLSVTKSASGDTNFTILTQPSGTVNPGASTTFSIRADPDSTGLHTVTISVASSDSNENPSTFDVTVIGGNAADIVVRDPSGTVLVSGSSSVNFGSVIVDGGTSVLTFSIKNIGHSTLTPIAASITGPNASEFTLSTIPTSLGLDVAATFTVTFNPADYSTRSAVLSITSNDPDESPFTISLSGSGTVAGGLTTYQSASIVVGQADFDDQVTVPSTSVTPLPAGCAVSSRGRLAICDTVSSCVRIWDSVPTVNGKACDVTLGTVGIPGVSSTRFNQPFKAIWNGDDLLVCDTGNNRVLRFINPTTNGQAAANVIGQTNFTNSGAAVSSSRLDFPTDCAVFTFSDTPPTTILLVSDTNNNRVLRWNTVPSTSGVAANVVIGQSGFTSKDTGSAANRFYAPGGISVSPVTGRLYVADQINNRVSIFGTVPSTNNASAFRVIGLPAFGNVTPGASNTTLKQPLGVTVSLAGFVAVSESRAVKVWYEEPTVNGAAAHAILGQVDFDTSLNWGNVSGTPDAKGFVYPMGLQWYGNDLLVSDPDGRRTLIFKP